MIECSRKIQIICHDLPKIQQKFLFPTHQRPKKIPTPRPSFCVTSRRRPLKAPRRNRRGAPSKTGAPPPIARFSSSGIVQQIVRGLPVGKQVAVKLLVDHKKVSICSLQVENALFTQPCRHKSCATPRTFCSSCRMQIHSKHMTRKCMLSF